jgi:hypothetical protein
MRRTSAAGRPPRQVRVDQHRPGRYGCEDRVAWLLRANRLFGPDERLTSLTRFAAAFRGGCWQGPASPSQVSRWETAAVPAGFAVLRRYEQLLGLPAGQLTAVADWAYRKAARQPGPPALSRGLDPADPRVHDRAGQLLEQALSAELMAGRDWDELTACLLAFPAAFVYPGTAWAELGERLLAELLITDGPAWLSRVEALARLLGHPRARPPAIAACASLAADTACQVVIEPLAILDQTTDQDASTHVLAQLANPSSDRALRGALLAAVEKTYRRHFRPAQLRAIAATVAGLLPATDPAGEAGILAAELLRQAPVSQFGTAGDQLRRVTGSTTRAVLAYGRTASPEGSAAIVGRVLAAVTATMAPPDAGPDPVLSCLVSDLLFSPNQNQRLLAGRLIAATPYRDPVGAALATELAAGPATQAVPLITGLLGAMPSVGRPAERPIVERFAYAPGLPAPITDAAAWHLAHVSGRSDRRFWHTAIAVHRNRWQRTRSQAGISALRGLTYSLGIGQHDDLLRAVRADTRLPGSVRTAAAWWLNIPERIRASAAR